MNHFNRFPSPSSRPLFPAYDRNHLSHAPTRLPFRRPPHPLDEFDLGRPDYGVHASPMPGNNFHHSYNSQRFQSPVERHVSYKHGPVLPPQFSDVDSREDDNYSASYSSPNTFQNQFRTKDIDYRHNYLADRGREAFENNFSQHNAAPTKNVPNSLLGNQSKLTNPDVLSSNFKSDRDFMPQNSNNSLKETNKFPSTEMPDESILMRVKEIQNLQNLLNLSKNLSLIDEMSSNSSQHSPAILDDNSVEKIGRNISSVQTFPEMSKSSKKSSDVNMRSDKKIFKNDIQEDDLYTGTFEAQESMLGNRITEMLCNVPKVPCFTSPNKKKSDSPTFPISNSQRITNNQNANMVEQFDKNSKSSHAQPVPSSPKIPLTTYDVSNQSQPVFSTSLLFDTISTSCTDKNDEEDDLYSTNDKSISKNDPYFSNLYSEGTKRNLSSKSQSPVTTFSANITADADWPINKAIPFLCDASEDKLADALKGELPAFQDGISSKNASSNASEEADKSNFSKSFLEDALDVLVEKEAVVGLEYIIEYKNMVSKKGSLPFSCKLCNSSIGRLTVVSHVLGSKHRLNYLKAKDEMTYKHIMSQKLKNKEKDEIISKAVVPLEKKFGRGTVIVEIKEIPEEKELPVNFSEDSLIEVFEENSMSSASNEDSRMITDDANSSLKRSNSQNDKAFKILKVEKEEDNQKDNVDLDSKTHVFDDAQLNLSSKDSTQVESESIEPLEEKSVKPVNSDEGMDVAMKSDSFDTSWLLNALADYSISTDEEADTISKVIGLLLKSLLHFKLQTFKNVNLEQLMGSLSNGSEEALLKLLALLENNQQGAERINYDSDTKNEISSQDPCSREETGDIAEDQNNKDGNNLASKDTVEMSDISCVSETVPVSTSSDSVNTVSQCVTSADISITTASTIPTSQPLVGTDSLPQTVTSTPVSQVAAVPGLVPPPFFGWSNSPASTLINQTPSPVPNNFGWASPYPMMQIPGMPYYQQPASAFQQSMAAYSGYPQYGIPASQSQTATMSTGNYSPSRLPLLAHPPPPTLPNKKSLTHLPPPPPPLPPPTTSNQPPLPSSMGISPPPLPPSTAAPPPPSVPPPPPIDSVLPPLPPLP